MLKEGLWCCYCGTNNFLEIHSSRYPKDSRYSTWECLNCGAQFQDNPGYGYFATYWGKASPDEEGKYSTNTGRLLDPTKRLRTPEGILRHSDSRDSLKRYLSETEIK